ncbi:uncharacterized protein LACBIDRAFT_321028 [Laccaria bicolor S238N-H82]|uniref:Predicted protein n=1 Tax=Laccaria bicolor (strain S238N-H82 / ATCC MYA-4686) TaxID=486041 RepID=B0CNJ1_LACBS|nr:uncharacterized protein LACBIDRAFT_321028 [Laccaria bicolor S238N-H82]EDR15936.1 predicted protein [Laccaria bicolor S238N-H82]|eukprot:XP_001874144.1 predicted protein [Laccaria bicolor S238N-H82]
MPIPLPPQAGAAILPPAPQDPPVLADVVRAKYYLRSVETSVRTHVPNGPTPDDEARADIYKTQVALAHSAGDAAQAPPWFLPALNAALNTAFTQQLTPLKFTLTQTYNMLLHDGENCPFDIVPFPDGSMPNAPPHNLPLLTSAATIAGLNPSQLNSYCNGYVGVGHGLVGAASQTAIAQAIGCKVIP